MGILDRLTGSAGVRFTSPDPNAGVVAELSETPTEPAPVAVTSPDSSQWWAESRAYAVALQVARSIPAVRKAEHVIAGTLGTFRMTGKIDGTTLPSTDPRVAWLAQPDPVKTSQAMFTRSALDVLWYDRCVWKIEDRTVLGTPTAAKRLHPNRIDVVRSPLDPDEIDQWIIDGRSYTDPIPAGFLVFDGAGLGGLRTFGYPLLTLYGELMAAAGRYARAPHPHAILRNHGPDLTDEEIDALLDSWSNERRSRGIGYLNDSVDYERQEGYSAQELQLTEAREHAAVEVARLFGLPAFALDAKGGDPMTYSNRVDRRRDTLDSLLPWRAVFEQGLSLDDRRVRGNPRGVVLPHGVTASFDTESYERADAADRMPVWRDLIELGLADTEDVRRMEPLAGRNPQ